MERSGYGLCTIVFLLLWTIPADLSAARTANETDRAQGGNRGGPTRPPEFLERICTLLLVAWRHMQPAPQPAGHQVGSPVMEAQGKAVPARREPEFSQDVEPRE